MKVRWTKKDKREEEKQEDIKNGEKKGERLKGEIVCIEEERNREIKIYKREGIGVNIPTFKLTPSNIQFESPI